MRLRYPLSPELVTLAFATCQSLERALKNECGMSVLQCRVLSLLQQQGSVKEADMVRILHTSASQLSQTLGKLAIRDYVYWEAAGCSTKSWACTALGRRALENADVTVIEVYDQHFSGLDPELHTKVRAGLRLTSQAHGLVRLKDNSFFDELAYFESVLPSEQIVIKSSQEVGLNAAQFRVMYQLFESGPQSKARLAKSLVLARSTITWTCTTLVERGLVQENLPAARNQPLSLTKKGRELAQETIELIDRRLCEMRVWSPEERQYNQQVAEYFARKQ